ncbi:MAG: toxin YoeB [Gammaproteobacteria bacterium RIFCSPHIGHO2_12_FULL_38_14]|nr:MAG: toxin YoeB [Gammaproteobacteria bacterium RIFCSPHIGHO2_12_FULL_38_14]
MNLVWTEYAWEDYLYWQTVDKKILQRINDLIKDIMRSPFTGIGKPEPLKLTLAGKWSRRINDEHRLVYEVNGRKKKEHNKILDKRVLVIYQCKYHY